MPYLSPDDRLLLLGPFGTCEACHTLRIRHYCRTCDEFFTLCHCLGPKPQVPQSHETHRLYLWTAEGVVHAIPDFDAPR
jgi:hypothetical protein